MKYNLPKQWRYWLRKHCNRSTVGRRYNDLYSWLYKGRYFRVCHLEGLKPVMQICDGNMDRWTNSVGYEFSFERYMMNENNFIDALNYLLLQPVDIQDWSKESRRKDYLIRKHHLKYKHIIDFIEDEDYEYLLCLGRHISDEVFDALEGCVSLEYTEFKDCSVIHEWWNRKTYDTCSKNNKHAVRVTFKRAKKGLTE